ncbi:DUF928 domain-containing protein [Desulfococcaceae bacterium HSG8]|nr:DUF928 domain-containing protein [Desulfococcaceae bacterium HSG8]
MKLKDFSKSCSVIAIVSLCLLTALPSSGFAGDKKESISAISGIPSYKPPVENATVRRIEAGADRGLTRALKRSITRGLIRKGSKEKVIKVPARIAPLAPQHTGFTLKNNPVLACYISAPWSGKMNFKLNAPELLIDPVVDVTINGPDKEGIYKINLADYKVGLKPGVEYEWFLSIIFDEDERSSDLLAGATIKFVQPSGNLSARLADTPKEKLYYIYAAEGYWYDAIASLSQGIEVSSGDKTLRMHRAELLKQVNLPLAAAYDSRGL